MRPPKRRKLTQRLAMVGHTAYSERIDGSMQVTAIEQNDRRSDKIERGSACLLIFQAAITKATKAVESHGSGQSVSRLTLVQFGSDLLAQRRILEPAKRKQGALDDRKSTRLNSRHQS